jgi:hypothetical protein
MGTHDIPIDAYSRLHVAELKARLLKYQRENTGVKKAYKDEAHYNETSAVHIRMATDTEGNDQAEALLQSTTSMQADVESAKSSDCQLDKKTDAARQSTMSNQAVVIASDKKRNRDSDSGRSDEAEESNTCTVSSHASPGNKKRSKTSDSDESEKADVASTIVSNIDAFNDLAIAVCDDSSMDMGDLSALGVLELREVCKRQGISQCGCKQGGMRAYAHTCMHANISLNISVLCD